MPLSLPSLIISLLLILFVMGWWWCGLVADSKNLDQLCQLGQNSVSWVKTQNSGSWIKNVAVIEQFMNLKETKSYIQYKDLHEASTHPINIMSVGYWKKILLHNLCSVFPQCSS